jgi:hypothetical protein
MVAQPLQRRQTPEGEIQSEGQAPGFLMPNASAFAPGPHGQLPELKPQGQEGS